MTNIIDPNTGNILDDDDSYRRPNAGHILLPRRFVDVGMPQSRVSAKGRYQLRKLKNGVYTGEETPWFDNIILDSGLNRWGTGTIILGAAVGTGTTTPAATDTGLETQITYTTTTGTGHNVITAAGVSPYNNTRTFVYRTALGALNGNYSEVGVGWASGSMFSRARILDGGGSPTTISVASDEQIDIVYQLSVYPPLTDFTDTVSISGVSYTVTGRASQVNTTSSSNAAWEVPAATFPLFIIGGSYAFDNGIGAITSGISGGASGGGVATSNSYSNLSLQRTGFVTSGLADANRPSGIRSTLVIWGDLGGFQYEFSPLIPKDATKTLVLNYSITWARR
jgi:hypothetical protein